MSSYRKTVRFEESVVTDSFSVILSPVAKAPGDSSSGSGSESGEGDGHTTLSQPASNRTGEVSGH